jgi:hypothetical protein
VALCPNALGDYRLVTVCCGAREADLGSIHVSHPPPTRERLVVHTILWLIAVILVISGIVTIFRGSLIFGIVLIVVGLLVGPGGVSVFH